MFSTPMVATRSLAARLRGDWVTIEIPPVGNSGCGLEPGASFVKSRMLATTLVSSIAQFAPGRSRSQGERCGPDATLLRGKRSPAAVAAEARHGLRRRARTGNV